MEDAADGLLELLLGDLLGLGEKRNPGNDGAVKLLVVLLGIFDGLAGVLKLPVEFGVGVKEEGFDRAGSDFAAEGVIADSAFGGRKGVGVLDPFDGFVDATLAGKNVGAFSPDARRGIRRCIDLSAEEFFVVDVIAVLRKEELGSVGTTVRGGEEFGLNPVDDGLSFCARGLVLVDRWHDVGLDLLEGFLPVEGASGIVEVRGQSG